MDRRVNFLLSTIIGFIFALGFCHVAKAFEGKPHPQIHFGTLPVIQTLPLYVAAEKGYFKDEGVDVELIQFNSAMEKDIALSAGQIDGYFGDMMTPMVLRANHTPVKIIAENFNTTGPNRMFAIMAAPDLSDATLLDVCRSGVACASNTILDYLKSKLVESENISPMDVKTIEVKNIPIRLQMLITGQVSGAMLPEPLITLAEMKGARVLADDAHLGVSSTILAFDMAFLDDHPEAVRAFCRASNQAVEFINRHPEKARPIMNQNCRIPEPLKKTFRMPKFPKLKVPDRTLTMDVYHWLCEKQIIVKKMTFDQMVENGHFF